MMMTRRLTIVRIALLLLMMMLFNVTLASDEGTHGEEEEEQYYAVLFPSFCLVIGILVYYCLSRYLQALPYTAVMFLLGTLMGIGVALNNEHDCQEVHESRENDLNESIAMWIKIDSEVLLLVFLPGLIFKDATGLNVHLFRVALGQCLNFAFPMVLAGTSLTALFAYGVFHWSFDLCMAFGAILSATDPVAVASLLEEVGAPPRLKVHIGGEALLNDGAAMVFFTIFADRYLYELGISGVGKDVGLKEGVAIFFRMALGRVAVGAFFGLALLFILIKLDRRFNREENVVEVTATVAIAYIGYYVAEPVWKTSGVIATLTAGVLVKFLGPAVINDAKLLHDFWSLVEHLLNTVLFTLGGVVWGAVIVSGTKSQQGECVHYFSGTDWAYLLLLYTFLYSVRFFLFALNYPITSRIGLKTNRRETLFQIYGGLRGAVGIALAIALDNKVAKGNDLEAIKETRRLFGFVGGFAFMTLVFNGTTCGPLLRKLGLSDSTETRQKIVHAYQVRYRAWMVEHMVRLLAQDRFSQVNFALVKYHVPILADLTKAQLLEAVDKNKDQVAADEYRAPNLTRILPYLKDDDEECYFMPRGVSEEDRTLSAVQREAQARARKLKHELRIRNRKKRRSKSTLRFMLEKEEPMTMQELRTLFLSILKSAYEVQIHDGELEDRQFLSVTLEQSLEFAADAVSNGEPLCDWDFVHIVDGPITRLAKGTKKHSTATRCVAFHAACSKGARNNLKNNLKRLKIERCLCFLAAHQWAQLFFRREFEDAESELSESGRRVIRESQVQYDKAETELKSCDPKDVEIVSSHKFCSILLNSGVYYVSKLILAGLLKDEEAEHIVENLEDNLDCVRSCEMAIHPGELDEDEESGDMTRAVAAITAETKTSHDVDPTQTPF